MIRSLSPLIWPSCASSCSNDPSTLTDGLCMDFVGPVIIFSKIYSPQKAQTVPDVVIRMAAVDGIHARLVSRLKNAISGYESTRVTISCMSAKGSSSWETVVSSLPVDTAWLTPTGLVVDLNTPDELNGLISSIGSIGDSGLWPGIGWG